MLVWLCLYIVCVRSNCLFAMLQQILLVGSYSSCAVILWVFISVCCVLNHTCLFQDRPEKSPAGSPPLSTSPGIGARRCVTALSDGPGQSALLKSSPFRYRGWHVVVPIHQNKVGAHKTHKHAHCSTVVWSLDAKVKIIPCLHFLYFMMINSRPTNYT